MKQIIATFIILFSTLGIQAEETSLTQQAEMAYQSQNYTEAIALYTQILDKGQESWQLYYNLGNCYYKTGENARAILFYERAKLGNPGNADIQYNLQMAESRIVDKLDELPELFFVEWYNGLIMSFSADGWAYISIACFIIFLIGIVMFLSSSTAGLRKLFFTISLVTFISTIFAFSFANRQNEKVAKREYAIVMAPSVTAKGAPDNNGTQLFVIHEGLKVQITSELGDWVSIRLQDGNEGWVKRSDIEQI